MPNGSYVAEGRTMILFSIRLSPSRRERLCPADIISSPCLGERLFKATSFALKQYLYQYFW